jgi:outer membrane receptor protein involved in Fe transport
MVIGKRIRQLREARKLSQGDIEETTGLLRCYISRVTDRAYTTADLTVQFHASGFTPFVKLENATDEHYDEVRGYPSPGRRLIAGLRFSK